MIRIWVQLNQKNSHPVVLGAHKTVLKETDLGICLTGLKNEMSERILRKEKSPKARF